MINKKDEAFLVYLLANTESGKLRWEPTASQREFTSPMLGQYTVAITWGEAQDTLTLRNAEGDTMLQITGSDDPRVNQLFPLARRQAYNVDKVLDDIMGGGTSKGS